MYCFKRDYILLKLKPDGSLIIRMMFCKHSLYSNLSKLFPFLVSFQQYRYHILILKKCMRSLARHLKLQRQFLFAQNCIQ